MAITTSAICNSFKKELLEAKHDFTQTSGDQFKISLYTSSATLGKSTTSFTTCLLYTSPSPRDSV